MEGSKVRGVLQAAQRGDKKAVSVIIAEGRVGVADDDGNTPLMYAAASGREEVLRLLLEKERETSKEGVKYMDLQNRYGWTALMQAACYGHAEAVVLLLQKGADPHLLNAWKTCALVLAAQGGHFGVVHALLSSGAKAEPEAIGEELEWCTLTPLMAAAQCGHVEVVQELLRGGARSQVKLKATKWTALMFAVLNNKVGVVELLLQEGADRESKDILGRTAVDLATAVGHHAVAAVLQAGNIRDISDSEFFDAVNKGNVDKVQDLLQLKPGMATIQDKDGAIPLMFASNKGHKRVCEVLLAAGAEVNRKDRKYGWTALMHATHHKRYEVVTLLGQFGADVNIRNNSGSTAYDIANVISDIKMIKLIANITVEQLESKTSKSDKPASTPTNHTPATPTESASTAEKPRVPSVSSSRPDTVQAPAGRKPARPIDLSELRSRLQNAYRTPNQTPKISVSSNESSQSPSAGSLTPVSPHFPSTPSSSLAASRFPASSPSTSAPRFPSKPPGSAAPRFPAVSPSSGAPRFPSASPSSAAPRFPTSRLVGRSPALGSSSPAPANHLQPSPGPKIPPSPSKSADSFPRNALPPKAVPPKDLPSPLPSAPGPGRSPFATPKNRVGQGNALPSSLGGRGSRVEGRLPPFNSPSRVRPDAFRGKSPFSTARDQKPFSVVPPGGSMARIPQQGRSMARIGGVAGGPSVVGPRRRANTEPISPTSFKKDSEPLDLRSVLEGACLERYITLFEEQEMDYESFLSLCEEDLKEMDITDERDREQLLSLISQLNSQQLSKSSSMDTDVFVFH